MFDEDKCECGANIPKGWGYYNYGNSLKCFSCGRINKRVKVESGWLTKAIIDKIKNKSINKKKREIEELKLEIEKAKLNKELKEIKK